METLPQSEHNKERNGASKVRATVSCTAKNQQTSLSHWSDEDQFDTCPICLNPKVSKRTTSTLGCGHTIHSICLGKLVLDKAKKLGSNDAAFEGEVRCTECRADHAFPASIQKFDHKDLASTSVSIFSHARELTNNLQDVVNREQSPSNNAAGKTVYFGQTLRRRQRIEILRHHYEFMNKLRRVVIATEKTSHLHPMLKVDSAYRQEFNNAIDDLYKLSSLLEPLRGLAKDTTMEFYTSAHDPHTIPRLQTTSVNKLLDAIAHNLDRLETSELPLLLALLEDRTNNAYTEGAQTNKACGSKSGDTLDAFQRSIAEWVYDPTTPNNESRHKVLHQLDQNRLYQQPMLSLDAHHCTSLPECFLEMPWLTHVEITNAEKIEKLPTTIASIETKIAGPRTSAIENSSNPAEITSFETIGFTNEKSSLTNQLKELIKACRPIQILMEKHFQDVPSATDIMPHTFWQTKVPDTALANFISTLDTTSVDIAHLTEKMEAHLDGLTTLGGEDKTISSSMRTASISLRALSGLIRDCKPFGAIYNNDGIIQKLKPVPTLPLKLSKFNRLFDTIDKAVTELTQSRK